MQDRYVGDVGDFGKIALLRRLSAEPGGPTLRLGMHWHHFRDENHNGDGRHVAYLSKDSYLRLDPALHGVLHALVRGNARSVAALAASAAFPPDTLHFLDQAVATGGRLAGAARLASRRSWTEAALARLAPADLVFFDPDNGIEARSVPATSPKAGKYVFWDELRAFWENGHSLVVYHHLNRTGAARAQVEILRARFVERLGTILFLSPLLFRRGSCRTFWVVGQRRHEPVLRARAQAVLRDGWQAHFEQG